MQNQLTRPNLWICGQFGEFDEIFFFKTQNEVEWSMHLWRKLTWLVLWCFWFWALSSELALSCTASPSHSHQCLSSSCSLLTLFSIVIALRRNHSLLSSHSLVVASLPLCALLVILSYIIFSPCLTLCTIWLDKIFVLHSTKNNALYTRL